MDPTRCTQLPDHVLIDAGDGWRPADGEGFERGADGVSVHLAPGTELAVAVSATRVRAVRLRWKQDVAGVQLLGDAWERGYGDLEWRGLVAERPLPWYVLIHDGVALHGLGVATGGGALASWYVDGGGVTLELDLRCGGLPVTPSDRRIAAATVRARRGTADEDEHAAAHAFCKLLCPEPKLPTEPIFGVNDWYYAYGTQDGAGARRDAERIAGWCPDLAIRPWCVLDAGWERGTNAGGIGSGAMVGADHFGDMAALAADIAARGARPGLWLRVLQAPAGTTTDLLDAPRDGIVLDPSRDEVLAEVAHRVSTAVGWGYGMLKHDFTTNDCFGTWGFQMGASVTADGWAFADTARTSAEIITALYATIRAAAGDALLIGCNTVGHLAAGSHEIQRTGDDTSGRAWERTRKMGPNTLAMRTPQHGAFFCGDADCVGLTTGIPWPLNHAWLEAIAANGSALFVSPAPDAVGPEQDAALRAAFAATAAAPAAGPATSVPLDWRETTAPRRWRTAQGERRWCWDADGATADCPA